MIFGWYHVPGTVPGTVPVPGTWYQSQVLYDAVNVVDTELLGPLEGSGTTEKGSIDEANAAMTIGTNDRAAEAEVQVPAGAVETTTQPPRFPPLVDADRCLLDRPSCSFGLWYGESCYWPWRKEQRTTTAGVAKAFFWLFSGCWCACYYQH